MIAFPRLGVVVITPGKCASTTLEQMAIENAGILIVDAADDKHGACIPYRFAQCKPVLVIRHPAGLAESMFRHELKYRSQHDCTGETWDRFELWCRAAASGRLTAPIYRLPGFYWNHANICGVPTKIADCIRVETLANDICKLLGRQIALPHENASSCDPVEWNAAARTAVEKWARFDLQTFWGDAEWPI